MSQIPPIDESFLARLPLPLVQLYRRAQNAKTPLERHHAAYYIWEAALKLLGSVAIVVYSSTTDRDPELANRLKVLARPTLRHWWELVRRLIPVLADAGDQPFMKVRELLLGRTRDDLPRCAGLDAALCEMQQIGSGPHSTVRLTELFDRLVSYRERDLFQVAAGQRANETYDRMGRTILSAVTELVTRLDLLAGRRLIYIGDVRRQASGAWLVERFELCGDAPRRLESLELPEADAQKLPRPERVYLQRQSPNCETVEEPGRPINTPTPADAATPTVAYPAADAGEHATSPDIDRRMDWSDGADSDLATVQLRCLHPLLIHDTETGEVLFLNTRRGRRRVEHLCYSSGRVLDRKELTEDHRVLLSVVVGIEVDQQAMEQWASRTQDEADEQWPDKEPRESAGPTPRRIGEFELLSRLGRGAMGVVYRAWQPSLGRQVALKCLLRAGDPKAEARFAREIRALGRVEHSNLVKIFTSGSDGDQWFYAMELVEGATLAAVTDTLLGRSSSAVGLDMEAWHSAMSTACQEARRAEQRLSGPNDSESLARSTGRGGTGSRGTPGTVRDGVSPAAAPSFQGSPSAARRVAGRGYVEHVVELVRQVADAAHALHESGVIHRDIKPGNIIVTGDGANAVLMDLGLAQLADDAQGRLTRTRQFVGTLRYASPEQVLAVGTLGRRSDVYSLGVTLWELLTLRTLYATSEQTPTPELMHRIQYQEPERVRKYNPAVPGDLEAIVLKCLEKNPTRRYATSGELAEDLARWQRGDPVTAQPPTLHYVLSKYVRRHRIPIATAALLALAVLIGTAATFYRIDRARNDAENALRREAAARVATEQAREVAERERIAAEQSRNDAIRARNDAIAARNDAVAAGNREHEQRELAEAKARESRYQLVRQHTGNGVRLMDDGDLFASLLWFAEALRLDADAPDRQRMHRIRFTAALRRCPKLEHIWFHDLPVLYAEFSADGNRIVTVSGTTAIAGGTGEVRVWDAATGQAISPVIRPGGFVAHAIFSPDGRRLLTAGGITSPTGSSGEARVWDATSGQPTLPPMKHNMTINYVAFSPDGHHLVTAGQDATARLWDANTGEVVGVPMKHLGPVRFAAFSPDGSRLVTASNDRSARLWDAKTGESSGSALQHAGQVNRATFSPDSRRVVTASQDRTARIWDVSTGKPIIPPLEHSGPISCAVFSPDGTLVVTAGADQTARIWNADSGDPAGPHLRHRGQVSDAIFSADGRRILTASRDTETNRGEARAWDARTGQAASPPLKHTLPVNRAMFSPDGRRVLTASGQFVSDHGQARLWDMANGEPVAAPLRTNGQVMRAEFATEGESILTVYWNASHGDSAVRVWNGLTGEPITPSLRHRARIFHAELSHDARRIVTASDDRSARIWDAQSGEQALPPLRHADSVNYASFSRDGTRVVTASDDNMARVWDAQTGDLIGQPFTHSGAVSIAAINHDNTRVATASGGIARIWDLSTGQSLRRLLRHSGVVRHLVFSHDGQRVLTVSGNAEKHEGEARLWDSTSGEQIGAGIKHNGEVWYAAFNPDGRLVVTGSEDQMARIWTTATGQPITPPLRHSGHVHHVDFSKDGQMVITASEDSTARVWDAATGEALSPLLRHSDQLTHASFSGDGRFVATASHDGTARIWQIDPDERPADDLMQLAKLLAGQMIDPTGGLVPIEPSTIRTLWDTLRVNSPEDFTCSAQESLAWHRREADDCVARRRWAEAIRHLDWLIEREPARWSHRVMRGNAHAELANWTRAAFDFSSAIELGADPDSHGHSQALALWAAGDTKGCRDACAGLVRRFSDIEYPAVASAIAWTCAVTPEAVSDPARVVSLAERATDSDGKKYDYLSILGAALYRAGKIDSAIDRFMAAIAAHPSEHPPGTLASPRPSSVQLTVPGMPRGGHATDWLFLAMSHHRLGKTEQAQRWMKKAEQWIDGGRAAKVPDESHDHGDSGHEHESESHNLSDAMPWQKRLEIDLLRREATQLLGQ